MGCDIHMYIEYTNKKRKEENLNEGITPYWFNFGAKINPGRNYIMFAVLAGVRGRYKDSFERKGRIPINQLSWSSKDDFYIYVSENPVEFQYSVTLEQAKKWGERGYEIIEHNGKPSWVENPDLHTHTWMSSDELEKAFEIYKVHATAEWETEIDVPLEYKAILSVMRTLEGEGENEVRVVFCFDN